MLSSGDVFVLVCLMKKEIYHFYACGTVNQKKQVLGYTLFSGGQSEVYPCVLQYKKESCSVTTPLIDMKNEELLLQDILKSPSSLVVDESGECVRVFKIEDVVFSDDCVQLAAIRRFWQSQWILVKRTGPLYVEVIFPEEQKEEVFDAEKYFADKTDRSDFTQEKDEYFDIRRALKMEMWYQCLYEKINKLLPKTLP